MSQTNQATSTWIYYLLKWRRQHCRCQPDRRDRFLASRGTEYIHPPLISSFYFSTHSIDMMIIWRGEYDNNTLIKHNRAEHESANWYLAPKEDVVVNASDYDTISFSSCFFLFVLFNKQRDTFALLILSSILSSLNEVQGLQLHKARRPYKDNYPCKY